MCGENPGAWGENFPGLTRIKHRVWESLVESYFLIAICYLLGPVN